ATGHQQHLLIARSIVWLILSAALIQPACLKTTDFLSQTKHSKSSEKASSI
ncbi:hypothetical protein IWX90DRAFT_479337, partial [Phyllosticta citrichinensis]